MIHRSFRPTFRHAFMGLFQFRELYLGDCIPENIQSLTAEKDFVLKAHETFDCILKKCNNIFSVTCWTLVSTKWHYALSCHDRHMAECGCVLEGGLLCHYITVRWRCSRRYS